MSHCGLGGWKDQFKNCFEVWKCQVTETGDPTKSYKVTKYQGHIKRLRELGFAKEGLIWCLETYPTNRIIHLQLMLLPKGIYGRVAVLLEK